MSEVYLGNPPTRIIEWCKRKYNPTPTIEGTVCFTAKQENSTVGMVCMTNESESAPITVSLQTSFDKKNWTNWDGSIITLTNVGNKVYVKAGTGNVYFTEINFNTNVYYSNMFAMTGDIAASGNIQYLLDPTGTSTVAPGQYSEEEQLKSAFYGLFGMCGEALTDASELLLPATTLYPACYTAMFASCESLTATPALPATVLALACYADMFSNCISLTAAPALPATSLADNCYASMFANCESLTVAPSLPITTLKDYCYSSMFENCTSLTSAPALPATILAPSCYNEMFCGCESLATPPALPATVLADSCYEAMFGCCTSLTAAPILQSLDCCYNCYKDMFISCTSLTIPPALPMTNLEPFCYTNMFNGCTSLTAAPSLPANLIETSCYYNIFNNVTNITEVNMPNMEEESYSSEAAGNLATSHAITIHFKSEPSTENPVCFTATQAGSTVAMTCLEANSEGDM